ncbi:Competence protein ComM [Collinsella aerofaciens]|uniref:Competence protein ComM n=1 Tax=Collinsella aerofaciens TaxID=74426 RepID=A0A6N3D6K6_9ACTN
MTNRTVVHGAIVEAASAVPIDIAIEFKPGIPGMTILGIQDNAAVELRGIVRCALRAQGYTLPRNSGSIDVMPSPGYNRAFSGRIRDAGSLALPIALGILSASGQLEPAYIEDKLFFGSLDFGGNVTSCRGTIAVEKLCRELSLQGIVSAATPRGIRPYHSSLQSLDSISTDALSNPEKLIGRTMPAEPEQLSPIYPPAVVSAVADALATHTPILIETDSPERAGEALRAFFRVGESDEATLMRDLARAGTKGNVAVVPDVGTASIAGIVGGGRPILPGIISTASGGAIVLGNIDQASSHILQCVAAATRRDTVSIVRVDDTFQFPSDAALVMTVREDRSKYALKAFEKGLFPKVEQPVVVEIDQLEEGLSQIQACPGSLVAYRENVEKRIEDSSLYVDATSKGGIKVNYSVDGEPKTVELVKQVYEENDTLCIQAFDVTEGSESFGALWSDVTVNLDGPAQGDRTVYMKRSDIDPLPGILMDSEVFGTVIDGAGRGGCEAVEVSSNAFLSMRDLPEFREMVVPAEYKDIAIAAGVMFAVVPAIEAKDIALMPDGLVKVGGHDYTLYRGQTFEESQKVDAILDQYDELSVAPHRLDCSPSTKKIIDSLRLTTKSTASSGGVVTMERDVTLPHVQSLKH